MTTKILLISLLFTASAFHSLAAPIQVPRDGVVHRYEVHKVHRLCAPNEIERIHHCIHMPDKYLWHHEPHKLPFPAGRPKTLKHKPEADVKVTVDIEEVLDSFSSYVTSSLADYKPI